MRRQNIIIGGAHRGQRTLVRHILPEFAKTIDEGVIYDPETGRSEELRQLWREISPQARFQAFEQPIENIANNDKTAKEKKLVLTIDDIDSMSYVLENTENPTQWQLLLRGPGSRSPVMGLSGTIAQSDKDSRNDSIKLLKALSPFAPPKSSEAIWGANQLNAYALSSMRNEVSRYSAKTLAGIDHGFIGDLPLTILFNWRKFPLKIMDYPEVRGWREVEQCALNTMSEHPDFAVALVDKERAALFLVEEYKRGRRGILYGVLFQKLLPSHEDRPGWDQQGVVTD